MKILIVCSKNSGRIAPFITEQVDTLGERGVETAYFTVEQKGWRGYWKSRAPLLKKIKEFQPDVIHAHYGLSGLLANTQRKIPVITTYHGSDINNSAVFRFSKLSILLSAHNIFVSQKNVEKSGVKSRFSLIPCGVDSAVFYPQDKKECREKLHLDTDKKYILFAGAFENKIKNAALAKNAVHLLAQEAELLELKGYTREQVALLINAVDCCLMTSHTEGSPQFIKEAMACGCPIVSVDVGDVEEVLGDTLNCYICNYSSSKIAEKLLKVLGTKGKTNGRERIIELRLDLDNSIRKIISIYSKIFDNA